MGISVKTTVSCNLGCTYCYENEIRSAGNATPANKYDFDAMVKTVKQQIEIQKDRGSQEPLIIHGGEPLLIPKNHLEELFKMSYDEFGSVAIQTNGELIDDEHIELFLKYNCGVGVSIDGPGRLNMGRWKYSEEATLKYTEKLINTIKKLKSLGVHTGLIIVISRKNGLRTERQEFKNWLLEMKEIGMKSGRMNIVSVDLEEVSSEFELTNEELADFWTDMANFTMEHDLDFAPFRDVQNSLMNMGLDTCIFDVCDYYHTTAEQGVQPNGQMGNCLRTAKDGTVPIQDEAGVSFERYEILYSIPKEEGGCGGCRYWNICTGVCPGESEYGDWRAKSKYCDAYYALYESTEKKLKSMIPYIQLQPDINPTPKYITDPKKTFEKIVSLESIYESGRSKSIEKSQKEEIDLAKEIIGDGIIQVEVK